jgi:two-component system cell cycle response regulator DivK
VRFLPPLILLVDDFADGLEMYREYLVFRGYRVVTAQNGQDAIDAALAECPDLILMDIQMPDMSGVEAMRVLRSHAAFARVPIVALTAHAMDNERLAMFAHGFDEVIPKPCLPDELVRIIERPVQVKGAAST